MASYRFSVGIIGRSTGRSAVACAAYRSGEKLDCDRYGERHDYRRKGGINHTEIIAPANAPAWARDRQALWNAVEDAENRKDAQLSREVQLSLPYELNASQRLALVQDFTREQFVNAGMIADVAIHAPNREGDERNHHAHIMLTLRNLDGDTFARTKNRAWNDTGLMENWREQWANYQNRAFEKLGLEVRVDHRSFVDRSIDLLPQRHEGVAATGIKRRGEESFIVDENAQRAAWNAKRVKEHTTALQEMAVLEQQKQKLAAWKTQKLDQLDSRHKDSRMTLAQRHEAQTVKLERKLKHRYGLSLNTLDHSMQKLETGLTAKGVKARLRRLWRGRDMRVKLEDIRETVAQTRTQMQGQRDRLQQQQKAQKKQYETQREAQRKQVSQGIEYKTREKETYLKARTETTRKQVEKSRPLPTQDDLAAKAAQQSEKRAQTITKGKAMKSFIEYSKPPVEAKKLIEEGLQKDFANYARERTSDTIKESIKQETKTPQQDRSGGRGMGR